MFAGGRSYEVTGAGYEPSGEVQWKGSRVDLGGHPALAECLTAGVLCNNSQLVRKDGRTAVRGDPTEAAHAKLEHHHVAAGLTFLGLQGVIDPARPEAIAAVVESAVEEGRCGFDNLTKFLVWTLPTNGGEALVVIVAIFGGMTLPVLPMQLLWVNMTTAVLPGLMLVFESKEKYVMSRPPRDPREPILTFPLLMRTGLVTLVTTAGALILFHWEQQAEGDTLAESRAIVVNTIVMVETL